MFSASITFSESVSPYSLSFIQQDIADLSFRSVREKGFEFFCGFHPNLPYAWEESYYFDESADIMVLLSGTIYNKHELTLFQQKETHVSDPELIAYLFLQEGPDFVTGLNGDFTIIIYKPLGKEIFLFRDHIGIRPLAWTIENETLLFSNDIIGFSKSLQKDTNIDTEYLLGYFKYIDYKRTPNNKIRKLIPGHFLHYCPDGLEIKKYWHPEKIKTDKKLTYEKALSDLEELVIDAVRIRSDARFTAGAHMSSGIDSGIIASLARQEYKHQSVFYGFSWTPLNFKPGNIKRNERDIIITASKKTGITPVFSTLDETRFLKLIADYYYNQGYFSEAYLAEQAVSEKVNLIFTGWGGDEFISTGHSGIDLDLLRQLKIRAFFRRNPLNKPGRFIRRLLFYVIYPLFRILDPDSKKALKNDVRYVFRPYKKSDSRAIRNFYFHNSRRRMHLNVLGFYNLPERCESWYRFAFRQGLEYRFPLLDKRIIEYMLKVPSELLSKTNYFRPLLRELSTGILPDEIRLNEDKNDPVYWAFWDELIQNTALSIMEEVSTWKENPDLYFIDFGLLTADIEKYKKGSGKLNREVLFAALVYIKGIHEFTVKYSIKKQNDCS